MLEESQTPAQEEWEQIMGEAQADGIDLDLEAPEFKDNGLFRKIC